MDTPFATAAWQPTKPPEPGQVELADAEVTSLIERLNKQTKHIYEHPYDPNTWLQRAKILSLLRYPELAVGDTHKASTLSSDHLVRLQEEGSEWRLGHRMGFWMRTEPEDKVDAEARHMLGTYLSQLWSKAQKVKAENMYFWPVHEEGTFRRRQYPWMRAEHGRRSDELVDQLNREFEENWDREMVAVGSCVVRRHAFGRDVTGKRDTSNILGIFAACDIDKGESILIDRTRVWGCNGPGTDGSLANLHGGQGCSDPIHPNDGSDDVGMDLRWVRDAACKQARLTLIIVRLLLCCVQDGVEHPLDHPLVARITPTYSEKKVLYFSLANDIAIPNTALQQMGIDIFANSCFDTWVLFTIQARVHNNSCGDPVTECLSPLFSLFNHSCEPNCEWSRAKDHRTVMVKADRDLKKGEQLFVEYDSYMSDQPLEIRRKRLWQWLEAPCMCSRCVREEKDRLEGRWGSASGGDNGKADVGKKEKVDKEMAEEEQWDMPEKELPIL